MSANIMDESRVFAVGGMWHGLGTVLDNPATAKEAIMAAKLDFKLEAKPIYFLGDNPLLKYEIPNKKSIVNPINQKSLGIVSDHYEIIQNVDAFNFFDIVVGDGQAIYTSAGALGYGERVWIQAKLPNDIVVKKFRNGGDDNIEKYLLLTNSHDGKSSLKVYFTPVRVVCQNTLNLSLSDAKGGISITHKGNVMDKIDDAREILGLSIKYYDRFEQIVKQMDTVEMQREGLNKYFESVLGVNPDKEDKISTKKINQLEKVHYLYHNGKGNQGRTLYDAYNAITDFADHARNTKNLKEDPTNQLRDAWFGTGSLIKEKAFSQAVSLMG